MLRLLTPDLVVQRIADIDQDALAQRGIRALLVDLDNTLCPWKGEEVCPSASGWMAQARERFGVCIVSNSIRPRRLTRVAGRLGVEAVGRWGFGRKPFGGAIREALRRLDVPAHEAAMIGDQIFTDILGGNRLGLYTIWVQPLQSAEFVGTRLERLLERLLLPRFRRLGLLTREDE